jgi:hypothetical protein
MRDEDSKSEERSESSLDAIIEIYTIRGSEGRSGGRRSYNNHKERRFTLIVKSGGGEQT